ncbi:MAG: hypothetical protein H7Y37_18805 [Anaerolineae bacterium]|nr:hypothetical protein [Gloeobacterales cyanobacterium ES-bin-313]
MATPVPQRFGPDVLDQWFPLAEQREYTALWMGKVGLTRRRAECFVRLWGYLSLKQVLEQNPHLKPPMGELIPVEQWVSCSLREAAALFYADKDQGSERAAGLMIDKLVDLELLQKFFDGNVTCFQVAPQIEVTPAETPSTSTLYCDDFDPRSDAISVAQMLARNYNWMNRSDNAATLRITRLLREWAEQYKTGMRVLRLQDSQQAVGFYLLYPTDPDSEGCFFNPPAKSLHLGFGAEVDPIKMAKPGDKQCRGVLVRSWVIDTPYLEQGRVPFLIDIQNVLQQMLLDFPMLSDLHTMIIHPSYEKMAIVMGFQRTGAKSASSLYWMYLPLTRYLALDLDTLFAAKFTELH